MKTRFVRLGLLCICLALSWAAEAANADLSSFTKDGNIVYENGALTLKQSEGSEQIFFNAPSALDDFTASESDRWSVENGKAVVVSKSGESRIPDGGEYSLTLTRNVSKVEFDYEVSTEPDYDFFRFYVDGELAESYSGQKTGRIAKNLAKGNHIFKWVFQKDECGRSNSDTVRIGTITFNSGAVETGTATGVIDFEKVAVWNSLQVSSSGNVQVQVVSSNDPTTPTTDWQNFASGLEGRYLHIKLEFNGFGSKVTGITYDAAQEGTPPTVTFVGLQERYASSPQLTIQLTDPSGFSNDSKVDVVRPGTNITFTPTVTNPAADKRVFSFNPSLTAPGFYTIEVTAIDGLENSNVEARTFFLGGDLALEPSFVIVPKDSGAKQGFQVSAKVGSNRQTLAAADLAGLTTVGEAGFGRFDRQGGAIYFTANGQTGVGTLTVTLLDMTAKARISTGTGLAVRIREWDSLSYPVTVYTPGGIQIAQLPAQRDVFLWDGLADYGAQTGKQGLPGLYLFKSANGASKKEVLAQAPVKTNLTAKVAVDTGQKLVSFGSGTTPFDFGDVVYASAYIGQGSKTLGWLGTKVVKDGAALPSWKWDETYDYSPTSGDVFAYVRLVTAGGQVAVSQGAKIGTVTAPLALKQLSFTQSIWQDVYENGLLKEDQDWKYDYEAGRLISKEGKNGQGTFTYAYDFEGRLTRIDLNGQMQWNASYDGDGRKVKETNFSQDREETTFFVYDKDERLAYQKSVIKDKNGQETEKETVYPAAEESK